MPRSRRWIAWLLAAAVGVAALGRPAPARVQEGWPDLSRPASATGGGEQDAAVVVGVQGYAFVPPVPGAEANALAWYDYLTKTRDVAPGRVKLLKGNDAAREDMLEAAQKAAAKAGPEGILWFVFIGHGAPSRDGKDGLLVGVDAQQKAQNLESRSLKRGELLKALGASQAGRIVVLLDACFSGRGPDGASIAPGLQPLVTVAAAGAIDGRMVVLTAAKGDQYAGALPGAGRPAFSYLVLGGLRGWAGQAKVTAKDLWRYAGEALDATLTGRNQTPDLIGREDVVVGRTAGENGPDLAALAKAAAGGGSAGGGFEVTNLPAVPKVQAPRALESAAAGGLDFRSVDIEALKRYNSAFELDKGEAEPEEKAEGWRSLAREAPKFADLAAKRAAEWDRFAAQQKAGAAARQKRIEARDSDWAKLSELLALAVVPDADKLRWSAQFVDAYLESPGIEPAAAAVVVKFAPAGPSREVLSRIAKTVPPVALRKAGIQWVTIPGGSFMMGSGTGDGGPVHRVTVKTFQLAKTETTNKQYRACIEAGACTAPGSYMGGDDDPVINVDWEQAKRFAEWAGGRLPSEAEWEYAARSAGKDYKYPWGDEEASCARAVIDDGGRGCGRSGTWPVCSKSAGNTAQGLCDMAGNVWEWTQDWYHGSYGGAPHDGSAWENPPSPFRVFRGGSWINTDDDAGVAMRSGDGPGEHLDDLGFRIAR